MDTLDLPAAHLSLPAGPVAEDTFLRWIGGSPQSGEGPLFKILANVWIPAGSVVEIPDPPRGRDPGWMTIAYPPDARARFARVVEVQDRAEGLARGTLPPTRQQAIRAGLPEGWEMLPREDAGVSFWSTGNLQTGPYRSGFIVLSPEGLWFHQSFRSAPWIAGAPWGDWSRFRVTCAESTTLLHPVQQWGLERWNGESATWESVRIPGRSTAGGDWIQKGDGYWSPCADSKDLGDLLSVNPFGTQLPTGVYPVETRVAEKWIAGVTDRHRSFRPSRYPQIPGLGSD